MADRAETQGRVVTTSVTLPLWLLVLILLFAGVTFASHFLFPSVRWFFRGRAERLVARLNTRLDRPIEPFRLMKRQDRIVRLLYDARVMEAVTDHAKATAVPPEVAFEEARTYAREIVPGFSTLLYFGIATRAARWLSTLLYRVRIGRIDAELDGIDRAATVIFVINHRSNMDYVLVTWLVARRSQLSYAVGEWARVWPLSALIRAMGAYFIRRGDRNALYRRVLERYVQMAAADGTTQAIFPEGGLSLDGRVGAAKMGLLHYIVTGARGPGGHRDVIFVPVGIAYDRVLEDRILIRAATAGIRRFRARPLSAAGFAARTVRDVVLGRFVGFGTAAAGFGPPLSLRAWTAAAAADASTERLGTLLMHRIVQSVPVLPVPLVAAAFGPGGSRREIEARMDDLLIRLRARNATLRLPSAMILETGLAPLLSRGIVQDGDALGVTEGCRQTLDFYAASVLQILEEPTASDRVLDPPGVPPVRPLLEAGSAASCAGPP